MKSLLHCLTGISARNTHRLRDVDGTLADLMKIYVAGRTDEAFHDQAIVR